MGIVIFNGVSSEDYNIQVEHPPGYIIPERDYNIIHIPGRNGDIVLDTGSYKNVSREYEIAIGSLKEDFTSMANRISIWLNSVSGYARLEDTYEPEYYRLAMYKENNTIQNLQNQAGRTTISFDCKPERFIKSGDNKITFTSPGQLRNYTNFKSSPIITVKGSGSGVLRIGNYTITISNIINNSLTINCGIQDVYSGSVNGNQYVTMNSGFPKLVPGGNEISFSSGITLVEVTPKWWTL